MTILLLIPLSTQSGCYIGSQECYHSPQFDAKFTGYAPIALEVEGVEVQGRLISTETIEFIFMPVVTAVVTSGNPYHLQLWMTGEQSQVQALSVKSVLLTTSDGDVVFQTDDPSEFSKSVCDKPF